MGNWSKPDEVLPSSRFALEKWKEPEALDGLYGRRDRLVASGFDPKKLSAAVGDLLAVGDRSKRTKRVQEALFGDRHAWRRDDFERFVAALDAVEAKLPALKKKSKGRAQGTAQST